MLNPLSQAGLFLINIVFGLYIFVVLMRVVLQWIGADFYNPISQLVIRATNMPLKHLQRIIPTYRGIDFAGILWLCTLTILKLLLITSLELAAFPHIGGLFVWAFADLLGQLVNIFFYAILFSAVMSWFSPAVHSPVLEIVYLLTEPLLRLVRRWLPSLGGLDLSAIPVLIGLQMVTILLADPLILIGKRLAFM